MKQLPLWASVLMIIGILITGYFVLSRKKAPYGLADFKSFTYTWGKADSLVNRYSSLTGAYQYLDRRDSLIKNQVKLRSNDLIFLHNKINELGFWKLPEQIGQAGNPADATVYHLQFNYHGKSKQLNVYKEKAQHPDSQLDSAMRIISLVQGVIDEADNRYH